jgi:cystathionine beta-lyase/cystathionine gamma-synthase
MPIYQTSTYTQKLDGAPVRYEYARGDSPNREALESALASLERGSFGVVFASGMAACDAVLRRLTPGDHIIAGLDLYGGTYRLLESIFRPQGIIIDYCDLSQPGWESNVIPASRMVWMETPSNPLLQLTDIAQVAYSAHAHHLTLVVDNTFASPYLQNPLEWGADLVVHSTTKYIAGHSDVIGGAVIGRQEAWREHLTFLRNAAGAVISPFDAWLTLRGLKTLALRMQRHCGNAEKVAKLLAHNPQVERVYYPGLHGDLPAQMRLGGGMVSFVLSDDQPGAAYRVLRRLRLFAAAESLGGVESLASQPATMTHAALPAEERRRRGISDSLVRLSIGIEDPEDLLEDLEQALSRS